MSYKGKESYGTTLGGCFSLCATIFVFVYVILVFSAFLIGGRDYDESTLLQYQPAVNADIYKLSSYDMIPVI